MASISCTYIARFTFATATLTCPPFLAQGAAEISGTLDEVRAIVEDHPKVQHVTLTASHEETFTVDKANLSLIVTTKKRSLEDAFEGNQERLRDLQAALESAGIDADAIRPSKFSSTPEKGWFGKDSYTVINTVEITVTNDDHILAAARQVDASDDIDYGGIEVQRGQAWDVEKDATRKALDKILEKKALYEEMLGLALTPVGITSSDTERPERITLQEDYSRFSLGSLGSADTSRALIGGDTFKVTASVTFAITRKE